MYAAIINLGLIQILGLIQKTRLIELNLKPNIENKLITDRCNPSLFTSNIRSNEVKVLTVSGARENWTRSWVLVVSGKRPR